MQLLLPFLLIATADASGWPHSQFQKVKAHDVLQSLLGQMGEENISPQEQSVVKELVDMLDAGYVQVVKTSHKTDKEILKASHKAVKDSQASLNGTHKVLEAKDKAHDQCRASQNQKVTDLNYCKDKKATLAVNKTQQCDAANQQGFTTFYIPASYWPTVRCSLKTFKDEAGKNCSQYVENIDYQARGWFNGVEGIWKKLDNKCKSSSYELDNVTSDCSKKQTDWEDKVKECTKKQGEFKTTMCMYEAQAQAKCNALTQFNEDYTSTTARDTARADEWEPTSLAPCMLQGHYEGGEKKCLEDPAKQSCQNSNTYSTMIGNITDWNITDVAGLPSCTGESVLKVNSYSSYWKDANGDGLWENTLDHLKIGADGTIYRVSATTQAKEFVCATSSSPYSSSSSSLAAAPPEEPQAPQYLDPVVASAQGSDLL